MQPTRDESEQWHYIKTREAIQSIKNPNPAKTRSYEIYNVKKKKLKLNKKILLKYFKFLINWLFLL